MKAKKEAEIRRAVTEWHHRAEAQGGKVVMAQTQNELGQAHYCPIGDL